MKNNILFKSTLLVVLSANIFTSCVPDTQYDTPQLECVDSNLVKTKEVSQISAGPVVSQYNSDDVIEAYVVSSDKAGNFFKSISMQTKDGSRGFSVPVDVSSTFTNFEPGRKVYIKMKGLYTDYPSSGAGGMRIGGLFVNSSGDASVGRLTLAQYGTSLQRSCEVVNEEILTKKNLTINQVLNDANLNTLIELDNVQFSSCDPSPTYYDVNRDLGGATNHVVTDKEGNTIMVRVSSFSNFAKKPIAKGSGKIRGILTKFNSDYQFMVRTEDDIKFTNARFTPSFNESFDFDFGCNGWTNFSVSGTQVWSIVTSGGNPGGAARISGFAGSNNANEDWLISSAQNLVGKTSAKLSFDSYKDFSGNAIQVYVSTNYTGIGSPIGSTWTLLNPALPTGTKTWTNSGDVDLTPYLDNPNVYIAFKYTSTTSASATWMLDNIKFKIN